MKHGAIAVQEPLTLRDQATATEQTVAEVLLYGDCVLRFVSGNCEVRGKSGLGILSNFRTKSNQRGVGWIVSE